MSQNQAAEFNESSRDIFFQYSIFKCGNCLKFIRKEKFAEHTEACVQAVRNSGLVGEHLSVKGRTLAESFSKSHMTGFRSGCGMSENLNGSTRDVQTSVTPEPSKDPLDVEDKADGQRLSPLPGELIDIQDASGNDQQSPPNAEVQDSVQKASKRYSLAASVKKPTSSSRDKNLSVVSKKREQSTNADLGSVRNISRPIDPSLSSRGIRVPPKKPEPPTSDPSKVKNGKASVIKTTPNHNKPPLKNVKPMQKIGSTKEHDVPLVLNIRPAVREFRPVLQAKTATKPSEAKSSKLQRNVVVAETEQSSNDLIPRKSLSNEPKEILVEQQCPVRTTLENIQLVESIITAPNNQSNEVQAQVINPTKDKLQTTPQNPISFTQEFIKMVDLNSEECRSEENKDGQESIAKLDSRPSPPVNVSSYEDLRSQFKQRKVHKVTVNNEHHKDSMGSQSNIDSKSFMPLLQKPTTSERQMPMSQVNLQTEKPIHSFQPTFNQSETKQPQTDSHKNNSSVQNTQTKTGSKNTTRVVSSRANPKMPISNEGSFRKKLLSLRKSLNDPSYQPGRSSKLTDDSDPRLTNQDQKSNNGSRCDASSQPANKNQPAIIAQNTFNIVLNISEKNESQTVSIQSQLIAKSSETKKQVGGSVLRPPKSNNGSQSRSFVGKGR
jgi:hypothetical protein